MEEGREEAELLFEKLWTAGFGVEISKPMNVAMIRSQEWDKLHMSPFACDVKLLFSVFSLRVYSVHNNCGVEFLHLVLGWVIFRI